MTDPINMVADAIKKAKLGGAKVETPLTEQEVTTKPAVEIEEIEPVVRKKRVVKKKLGEGKASVRDVFSKDLPVDYETTVFKASDWNAKIRSLIPKVIPNYIYPPELTSFNAAIEAGEPILITGPTGCGKTTMVQQYAAVTKRPFIRMSMRGDIETSSILGMPQAKNGETVWIDGPVTQVVKMGGIVLFDEYDFTPPEINYSIQWLLEDDPQILLSDKSDTLSEMMVTAHPEFRIVFAGNTKGQGDLTGEYPGAQVQSIATMDRCKTAINMNYLSTEDEKRIIASKVHLPEGKLRQLMQLVSLMRESYKQGHVSIGISPRTEISIAEKWVYWNDPRKAFELAYLNKLDEKQVVRANDNYRRVFGSTA